MNLSSKLDLVNSAVSSKREVADLVFADIKRDVLELFLEYFISKVDGNDAKITHSADYKILDLMAKSLGKLFPEKHFGLGINYEFNIYPNKTDIGINHMTGLAYPMSRRNRRRLLEVDKMTEADIERELEGVYRPEDMGKIIDVDRFLKLLKNYLASFGLTMLPSDYQAIKCGATVNKVGKLVAKFENKTEVVTDSLDIVETTEQAEDKLATPFSLLLLLAFIFGIVISIKSCGG